MEPIPYFYESIDGNAIIIKTKEPFFNWINFVYPEKNIKEKPENNVYLVHEMDSNEEILEWIKANFEMIFINEFNDWYTREYKWPASRTF